MDVVFPAVHSCPVRGGDEDAASVVDVDPVDLREISDHRRAVRCEGGMAFGRSDDDGNAFILGGHHGGHGAVEDSGEHLGPGQEGDRYSDGADREDEPAEMTTEGPQGDAEDRLQCTTARRGAGARVPGGGTGRLAEGLTGNLTVR